ncbi:MAG: PEP-CTERM sorting domain-containing protein [Nitrospirae bacterium]|nr:MAG: PEP-CTERM sorting domain-containing protein [Nitrospirota bacterium]
MLVQQWLFACGGVAQAVPIASYEGRLDPNVPYFGQISKPSRTGSPHDDFWWFTGNAGDVITLTVNRLEAALDPAFTLYTGFGSDTSSLSFVTDADDEIPQLPGFAGPFDDPQLLNFTLPATGHYTVQVWSFLSGSPGADGVFDYQITLGTPPTGEVLPHQPGNGLQPGVPAPPPAVPEPATVTLFGLGLAGLMVCRLMRRPA